VGDLAPVLMLPVMIKLLFAGELSSLPSRLQETCLCKFFSQMVVGIVLMEMLTFGDFCEIAACICRESTFIYHMK